MKRKEYLFLLCLTLLAGACAGRRNQTDMAGDAADTTLVLQANMDKSDTLPPKKDSVVTVYETPKSDESQGNTVEIIYIPPVGDREVSAEEILQDTNNMNIHPVLLSSDVDNVGADSIYEVVEQMPEFPDGGMAGLIEYIRTHLRYPDDVCIQGRVCVQFVVMEDGSIEQAHVVRGICREADEEALRLVRSMPRWKPGRHRGKVVKVRYTMPVMFWLK